MSPVRIAAFTATSALGPGGAALIDALRERRSGLAPCDVLGVRLPTYVGVVGGLEQPLPASADHDHDLTDYDCRNNRLAELGLRQDGFDQAVAQAIARHGADRVGAYLGTSTSGMLEMELAYRRRDAHTGALPADFRYATTHNTASLARYVRDRFGLRGPALVISTACSSGAKAHAAAQRAIAAGLIDAAIVGGVDSLCLTTLYGFGSLELLSPEPCRPWDRDRNGISLSEAAAFVLLERAETLEADALYLSGCGESSDAHHMSSPHPQGAGAQAAMRHALREAGLEPGQIEYLNLHGTATPSNDAAEDQAVHQVFGDGVPASSTKGCHGHALGAAGALEAVVSLLCLRDGLRPAGFHLTHPDPALRSRYLRDNIEAPMARVMTNSFGFGGSNASLIFERGRSLLERGRGS